MITNTNKKGNKALGTAICYFSNKGYAISIPLNDTQSYDIIVEIEGTLYKVDVKYTSRQFSSGSYYIDTTTRGHNGYENKNKNIDYWFIVTEENKLYFVPEKEIETQCFTMKEKYLVSL